MIEISTRERVEVVDITDYVRREVERSGVKDGIAVVYTYHTTTALIINENEEGLKRDVITILSKLIPTGAGYMHDRIDSNADAHLRSIILGNSVVVPVKNGRLDLGTWQRIMFVELDGPRRRRVSVIVLGERG